MQLPILQPPAAEPGLTDITLSITQEGRTPDQSTAKWSLPPINSNSKSMVLVMHRDGRLGLEGQRYMLEITLKLRR